jgi:putative oxidoreductase
VELVDGPRGGASFVFRVRDEGGGDPESGEAAALSEFAGGLCLILGLFFRPACLLLAITMGVAANMHLGKGEGILAASHAIELGILFFSLLFIGPGRYSVDKG